MGQSQKKDDGKSNRARQKNKRTIEKWDQTESPEIPERGKIVD